jgi:hypothetical protein
MFKNNEARYFHIRLCVDLTIVYHKLREEYPTLGL